MLVMIVLACLLVLMAMLIDLGAGLYKAKQRGEVRSSWWLKRSLTKFITYEGGLLIAAGVQGIPLLADGLIGPVPPAGSSLPCSMAASLEERLLTTALFGLLITQTSFPSRSGSDRAIMTHPVSLPTEYIS